MKAQQISVFIYKRKEIKILTKDNFKKRQNRNNINKSNNNEIKHNKWKYLPKSTPVKEIKKKIKRVQIDSDNYMTSQLSKAMSYKLRERMKTGVVRVFGSHETEFYSYEVVFLQVTITKNKVEELQIKYQI